ncbi:hypothetical protein ACFCV3_15360 [Kribbella sp. NPDC056345]|uniref:hypothetical protein n=1 Tax=Kribbella sp. NPDC056345 TaxID=3345789 RepID=UPI0035E12E64
MHSQRLAGWAGLGFAGSVILANLVTVATELPPQIGATPAEVATFFAEHGDAARISSAIAPIAWMFLAVFAAGTHARWRKAEQDRGEAWTIVGVIGAVLLISLFAGVVGTEIALVDGAPLWSLHNAYFAVNAIGIALTVGGFSMAGLRTGNLRPWHAYLGLASGLLTLTNSVLAPWSATTHSALGAFGFAGFGLWIIWITLTSAGFLRSPAPVAATSGDREGLRG